MSRFVTKERFEHCVDLFMLPRKPKELRMTKYWPSAVLLVLALGVIAAIAAIGGCDVGRVVHVNVPTGVQQRTASPPRIPLNEASDLREQYRLAVEKELRQMDSAIDDAAFWASLVTTGVDLGVDYGALQLAGLPIPGAAVGASLLTLVGGVFAGRISKEAAKEKAVRELREALLKEAQVKADALYDEGLAKGQQLTLSGASAIGGVK